MSNSRSDENIQNNQSGQNDHKDVHITLESNSFLAKCRMSGPAVLTKDGLKAEELKLHEGCSRLCFSRVQNFTVLFHNVKENTIHDASISMISPLGYLHAKSGIKLSHPIHKINEVPLTLEVDKAIKGNRFTGVVQKR